MWKVRVAPSLAFCQRGGSGSGGGGGGPPRIYVEHLPRARLTLCHLSGRARRRRWRRETDLCRLKTGTLPRTAVPFIFQGGAVGEEELDND